MKKVDAKSLIGHLLDLIDPAKMNSVDAAYKAIEEDRRFALVRRRIQSGAIARDARMPALKQAIAHALIKDPGIESISITAHQATRLCGEHTLEVLAALPIKSLLDMGLGMVHQELVASIALQCASTPRYHSKLAPLLISHWKDWSAGPRGAIESKRFWPVLSLAVRKGDVSLLKMFLEHGFRDVHEPRSEMRMHESIMHKAFERDQEEAVKLLLTHGWKPSITGDSDYGNLYYAAESKAPRCFQVLLEAGADPNAKSVYADPNIDSGPDAWPEEYRAQLEAWQLKDKLERCATTVPGTSDNLSGPSL